MNNNNDQMFYRILSQTEGMTITAETAKPMTMQEAKEAAVEDVLSPSGNYQKFVVVPMYRTEDEWIYGHINFCPRCGKYIGNSPEIGDGVNNLMEFECPECDAHMFVEIYSTTEEKEQTKCVSCKLADREIGDLCSECHNDIMASEQVEKSW